MSQYIDLQDQKFGRLTVLKEAGRHKITKGVLWLCQCECGNTCIVMGKYLRKGEVKSCGCLNRQSIGGQEKHGHSTGGKLSPTL